ncbi:glycoside hydrolase family 30 protein [Curtanaerobium respiraculi]|uniref:glycoside hydrolase family 30 protein n=1 Tax=Curtanaerobium respiraculi TaxID=2949669 RepID=UPI0024B383E1|nr:glycoside hydrolase family 30 beta sandwich domain-containing protein [Curtanaerobium respiraculi]
MLYFLSSETERMAEKTAHFVKLGGREGELVRVYPHHQRHMVWGFGGAITEASAVTFARMDASRQNEFLQQCFSEQGSRYNMVRIALQSCDFTLAPYEYESDPADTGFAKFTIAHELEYVIPLLKRIQQVNPAVQFIASPWSPPAFMKSTRIRQAGGSLRKKHYQNWAMMVALALLGFRDHGIDIGRVTVQNEPHFSAPWDSCRYTAESELAFAARFLRPVLDAAGLEHVRILGWDHNKERLLDRADAYLGSPKGSHAFAGMAFHIYSGDHFEAVREVRRCYPAADLILTEGCMEYSDFDESRALVHAEKYAHEWLGDIRAGANACLDWNILLDETGGPTYVGNFCDAPLMLDRRSGELRDALAFSYLRHLTRFIQPRARVCACSSFTSRLETLAVINPDDTRGFVALNRTGDDIDFGLTDGDRLWQIASPAHSILSAMWK